MASIIIDFHLAISFDVNNWLPVASFVVSSISCWFQVKSDKH